MFKLCRRLAKDDAGTSSVEYGIILTMIVLAMFAALTEVANESSGMWTRIGDRASEASDKAR